MSHEHTGPQDEEARPDSAESWFARMRAGPLPPAAQEALQRWLEQDERNAEELDCLFRIWNDMEAVRSEPAVLAMRSEVRARARMRSKARWQRALVAAAAVCAVGLAALAVVQGARQKAPSVVKEHAVQYETRVGQKSTVTLPDGTLVVLDTDTVIQVWSAPQARRVRLVRGRAFFDVAHDPSRPFSVSAGSNTVTALGTEFDVELTDAAMAVTLLSGRLRVLGVTGPGDAGGKSVEMNAGQRLIAPERGPWTVREASLEVDTGWLKGRLVFDEETLGNIAAALNRYSARKIVIPDPQVAGRRLSAVLMAGDIETFIQAAETLGLARAGATDAHRIELVEP
ncbi:MAG: FecR domain-containing protein [Steroidobacteraceae bacterium]|jgi:transmembrane sensor|nr:FecR domain-containing protein [Steroidobacteraceae bacterium]